MKATLLLLLPGVLALPLPAGLAQSSAWQSAQQFFQQPAPNPQAGANNYSVLMTAGADSLVTGKYSQAATEFQKAADLDPQSAQAQFWAGQALVYADRPAQAIYFLERAQTLGTDSVSLHLALVAAYAGALKPVERNRESALLHAWHSDGQHQSLTRADGFLVETIFTHPWHINVMEYFDPQGSQHALWRFIVRDSANLIEATYVLGSGGTDHPFVLLHYTGDAALPDASEGSVATDVPAPVGQRVKSYDQRPAYDQVRSDVLQRVRSMPLLSKK